MSVNLVSKSEAGTKEEIQQRTTEQDLLQLAGHYAYKHKSYPPDKVIPVNNKRYIVEDVHRDKDTGLDAMTVENLITGERIVVFVGSEQLYQDWLLTNGMLPGKVPPAQLEAARAYFREMNNISEVSYVTGNSLGGANANYVGIFYEDVEVVTLNAAMLYGGQIEKDKEYKNIKNYYTSHDVLDAVQTSLRYKDRVPGTIYEILSPTSKISNLIANHKGYPDDKIDGEFKVEIGKKGEVGHGYIYLAADEHIVTNMWTGETLQKGTTSPVIKIDSQSLHQLANGVGEQVNFRLERAQEYLSTAQEIVEHEGDNFNNRLIKFENKFLTLLEDYLGISISSKFNPLGGLFTTFVDPINDCLHQAECNCSSVQGMLSSPPSEIVEHITKSSLNVDTLFAPIRGEIAEKQALISQANNQISDICNNVIPSLFVSARHAFRDAVVDELKAHYNILQDNVTVTGKQVRDYIRNIRYLADVYEQLDYDLASSINQSTGMVQITKGGIRIKEIKLTDSPYLENVVDIKDEQYKFAQDLLSIPLKGLVTILGAGMTSALLTIETIMNIRIAALKEIKNIAIHDKNLIASFLDIFFDFRSSIESALNTAIEPIEEARDLVTSLRSGFTRLSTDGHKLVDELQSYLKDALFGSDQYMNVKVYNVASNVLYEEIELLFTDITQQLSHHKGEAIEASLDLSQNVLKNIKVLKEQSDRGIMT